MFTEDFAKVNENLIVPKIGIIKKTISHLYKQNQHQKWYDNMAMNNVH